MRPATTSRRCRRRRWERRGGRCWVCFLHSEGMPAAPERVLLAAPRGYCAGVDRAVETVERALKAFGAPIYVRKQIVHNLPVVRDLESKGAIFVEELEEVPAGATAILSAHGVAPEVYEQAKVRNLR